MLALLLLSLDLFTPQASVWYEHLLAEGGYGQLQRERAAFLIRESDGSLTLAPWPHGGHRHARYRGAVPARTIAVLHTHPRTEPRPSARDRAEARRLRIPVVVITPEGVVASMPDQTEIVVATAARTPVPASGTTRAPSAPRTSLPR